MKERCSSGNITRKEATQQQCEEGTVSVAARLKVRMRNDLCCEAPTQRLVLRKMTTTAIMNIVVLPLLQQQQ
ncbi:hypothetical protein E2C01_071834 [Portunus trituberculatus]|uniref:Uncharacterized protein n=1 Tax=Portunus trituberculatus TaxID=210409 RepID=A0A5B7I0Z3_PORTR|nr:hypothetical protein [Portunus trituberculatus]